MVIGCMEISIISIVGPILLYKKAGTLQARRDLYRVCTKSRIIFLRSPCLYIASF